MAEHDRSKSAQPNHPTLWSTLYRECSVATKGAIILTRDKQKLQDDVKKQFVCEFCGLELSSRQQLIAHTYRHTGDLPFKCDVQGGDSIDMIWIIFGKFYFEAFSILGILVNSLPMISGLIG